MREDIEEQRMVKKKRDEDLNTMMKFHLSKKHDIVKADIYENRDLTKMIKGAYSQVVQKHDDTKEKFGNLLGGKKKKVKVVKEVVTPKEPEKVEYVDNYGVRRTKIIEIEPEIEIKFIEPTDEVKTKAVELIKSYF